MLTGQSNMVGENFDGGNPGDPSPFNLPQITQLGRYLIDGYSPDGDDDYHLVQGGNPLEFDNTGYFADYGLYPFVGSVNLSSGIGPGMPFAYSFVNGQGQNVTLIPCAVGSTPVQSWQQGEPLYEDCLNRTQTVLNLPYYYLAGNLWIQGEANTQGYFSQSSYTSMVQSMVSAFRSDLAQYPGTSTSVFLAGQMRPAWVASLGDGQSPGAPSIQQAINQLPYNITRCASIYGLGQGGHLPHLRQW